MATAKLQRSNTPVATAAPARLANYSKTTCKRVRGVCPGETFSVLCSATGRVCGKSEVSGKVRFWYW